MSVQNSESETITALMVPADDTAAVTLGPIDPSVAGISRAVGGGIPEEVWFPDLATVAHCDSDGKVNGLPNNRRATQILDLLMPGLAHDDALGGDVVITGYRSGGYLCDVPSEVLDRSRVVTKIDQAEPENSSRR